MQDDRRKSRGLHSGGLNYLSRVILHSGGLNYFSSWLFCDCLHSGAPVRGGRRGQVLLKGDIFAFVFFLFSFAFVFAFVFVFTFVFTFALVLAFVFHQKTYLFVCFCTHRCSLTV